MEIKKATCQSVKSVFIAKNEFLFNINPEYAEMIVSHCLLIYLNFEYYNSIDWSSSARDQYDHLSDSNIENRSVSTEWYTKYSPISFSS